MQVQIFWNVTGSQDSVKITEDLKIWIFIPLQSLQSILLTCFTIFIACFSSIIMFKYIEQFDLF